MTKANRQLNNLAVQIAEIMLRHRKEPTTLEFTANLTYGLSNKPATVYIRFTPER